MTPEPTPTGESSGDLSLTAALMPSSPSATAISPRVASAFNAARFPQLAGDNLNWLPPPGAAQGAVAHQQIIAHASDVGDANCNKLFIYSIYQLATFDSQSSQKSALKSQICRFTNLISTDSSAGMSTPKN
eukprot:scaffold396595_cov40-Prasinocladus_malaysianus.AAC.1